MHKLQLTVFNLCGNGEPGVINFVYNGLKSFALCNIDNDGFSLRRVVSFRGSNFEVTFGEGHIRSNIFDTGKSSSGAGCSDAGVNFLGKADVFCKGRGAGRDCYFVLSAFLCLSNLEFSVDNFCGKAGSNCISVFICISLLSLIFNFLNNRFNGVIFSDVNFCCQHFIESNAVFVNFVVRDGKVTGGKFAIFNGVSIFDTLIKSCESDIRAVRAHN